MEKPSINPIDKNELSKPEQSIESPQLSEQQKNIQEVFKLSPELKTIASDSLGIEDDKDIIIELGRNKDEAGLGKIQNINVYYKGELILNSDDKSQSKKLILVTQKDGTSFVGDILLPEELQGKGLGAKILQKVSNELNTKIIPSHTVGSHHTSPSALRMWEKIGNEILPNHEIEKLYADYLKTIFPESKIQDIVWHGTPNNTNFNKFIPISRDEFGGEIKNAPVYFTNSIFYAKGFAENEKQYKKIENSIPSMVPALINIKEFTPFNKPITRNGNPSFRFATEYNKEDLEWTEYTVSPDDIHILGSEDDIEKFKEFISKNKDSLEL